MAIVRGDDKDNDLTATDNPDTLYGYGGDDHLTGYAAGDKLFGGDGSDLLNGGYGSDLLNGGEGVDWADFRYESKDVVANFSQGVVEARGDVDTLVKMEGVLTGSGDDRVTAAASGSKAYLFKGDDRFVGGAGDDFAAGGGGADRLDGGQGHDTLNGLGGNDAIFGSGGFDTADYYFVPDGSNAVSRADVMVDLQRGVANIGSGERDQLSGIEQVWTGSGDDRITGDAGANSFYAGAGNDALKGGGGNDTLSGDAGRDALTGGGGQDLFKFDDRHGVDTIRGFQDGVDRIDLTAVRGIDGAADLAITQTGQDVTIDYGSGRIVLANTDEAAIGNPDFLF